MEFQAAGRRNGRPVRRDRRYAKGSDRAPLHIGGENFSDGYGGKISPVSGSVVCSAAG